MEHLIELIATGDCRSLALALGGLLVGGALIPVAVRLRPRSRRTIR